MKLILFIENKFSKIEELILAFLVFIMIFFSILQISLRNIFNSGMVEADMFIRSMVLWVGFIGANLAVRRSKHINIDLFSKLITNKTLKKYRFFLINFTSFICTSFLLYLSVSYFISEIKNNMNAFFGVKTYYVFSIIPISFFLMSIRFLILIFLRKNIEDDN